MTRQTFGETIREARKKKNYGQRILARLMEIDHTYLSKMENDQLEYPPKEDILASLAKHLDLDLEELFQLSGRIAEDNTAVLQKLTQEYHHQIPDLLRKMQKNPELVKKLLELKS